MSEVGSGWLGELGEVVIWWFKVRGVGDRLMRRNGKWVVGCGVGSGRQPGWLDGNETWEVGWKVGNDSKELRLER